MVPAGVLQGCQGIIPRKHSWGVQWDTQPCTGIVWKEFLFPLQNTDSLSNLGDREWEEKGTWMFLSLSPALKDSIRSGLRSAEWLLELTGIQRLKDTARAHRRGLVLHPSSTVVLGLNLFCQGDGNRRASRIQATELNSCSSSLHPYPLYSAFPDPKEKQSVSRRPVGKWCASIYQWEVMCWPLPCYCHADHRFVQWHAEHLREKVTQVLVVWQYGWLHPVQHLSTPSRKAAGTGSVWFLHTARCKVLHCLCAALQSAWPWGWTEQTSLPLPLRMEGNVGSVRASLQTGHCSLTGCELNSTKIRGV